jgi:hypothetical protein
MSKCLTTQEKITLAGGGSSSSTSGGWISDFFGLPAFLRVFGGAVEVAFSWDDFFAVVRDDMFRHTM